MTPERTPDDVAADHYEDPAAHEPAGPPIRRSNERRMMNHVPVRFPAETIDRVRWLAEREGITVSAWIRGVVSREVERQLRSPSATELSSSSATFTDLSEALRTLTQRDEEDPVSELPRLASGS